MVGKEVVGRTIGAKRSVAARCRNLFNSPDQSGERQALRPPKKLQEEERRIVVVTGCRTGIGHAVVKYLLSKGCLVYGSVRREEDIGSVADAFKDTIGEFVPLVFDIRNKEAVAAAAATVSKRLEGNTLFALVNNAGINVAPDPLELIPSEKFRLQMEVNVLGTMTVIQEFLPLLGTDRSRSGSSGRIINIGSIYGCYGIPWQGAYCATKFALEGLSDALRMELRIYGIKVSVIRPGPVNSAMWLNAMKEKVQGEGGSGNWAAYERSQYGPAMTSTKLVLENEVARSDFFVPASKVAEAVWKAVTSRSPSPHYLVSTRFFANWVVPRTLPASLRDFWTAKRLGFLWLPQLKERGAKGLIRTAAEAANLRKSA